MAQTFVALPVVDGTVQAFAAFGNTLYIAGDFANVGGQTRNGLASIDLTTNTVSSWNPNPTVAGNGAPFWLLR